MIEDAAQALGATQEGRQAGTLGACGAVSFFPSKNLGALGDAGALLTNDDELFERSRILRMHGMEPKYHHREVGGNFRIDALQAAFLAVKLPRLADYAAKRQSHAEAYRETARPAFRAGPAGDFARPRLEPVHAAGPRRGPARRPAGPPRRARDRGRDLLSGAAARAGLLRLSGHRPDDFPAAHRLAGEVVSLPVFPEMAPAAREEVCAAVAEFFSR